MSESSKTLTVNLQQVLQIFLQMRMQDIRDIRSIDTDLLLVFRNGIQIVWKEGTLAVLSNPELTLEFLDGTLKASLLFKQIEKIEINEFESESKFISLIDSTHCFYVQNNTYQCELYGEKKWILL